MKKFLVMILAVGLMMGSGASMVLAQDATKDKGKPHGKHHKRHHKAKAGEVAKADADDVKPVADAAPVAEVKK